MVFIKIKNLGSSKGLPRVAQVVKNPPGNAENPRDSGLIPGSGRSPGERMKQPASGGEKNYLQITYLLEYWSPGNIKILTKCWQECRITGLSHTAGGDTE